ncbi:sorbitol dehydrogenase-like [Anneissia japonica]|uniref:sorbitol dehydrogenase-like n=1 Tax=Anneissia japonica TaxID=1529436 RepID=UPI0014258A74|nr:sorbitol dehydrogenase-like [Anneissia japonica]
MSNICATLHANRVLKLDKRHIPNPGNNEVLLSMKSVGICGSDLKYWAYGKCGRFVMDSPMVIGHEASGVVAKLGEGVTNLKVERLPDNVSFDEGALLEPLSVAVYGCERGGVGLGSSVLVCGAGPVGLLTMMTAKAMGADIVAITDIDDHRLSVAKSLGADHILKVPMSVEEKQFALQIQSVMGCAPDVTLECSGVDSSLRLALYASQEGGSVVMIGRGSMEPTIPLAYVALREIDIKGVFRYANSYPKALSLITSGKIDVQPLVSHHFTLSQSQEAFETAVDRESKAIKVIISCEN